MPSYQAIREFVASQIAQREALDETDGVYRPSKYWLEFNKYSRYVRALPDDELEFIRYHTWHLNGDMYVTYLFRPEICNDVISLYEHLCSDLADFRPGEIDNGIGFNTQYGKIGLDILRYSLPLRDIYEAGVLSRSSPQRVLEIGGGYGGLARLAMLFNPELVYVICDLEETLFYSAVFLSLSLGTERLHLIEGSQVDGFEMRRGHVYLVPQIHARVLAMNNFDLVLNQQSMQEMTTEQVTHYCDLIQKFGRFFYSCNMNEHSNEITDRTKIVRGVNSYLQTRFEVVWRSNFVHAAPTRDVVENSPRSVVDRLSSAIGIRRHKPAAMPEPAPALFNDLLMERMVFRVNGQ